MKLSKILAGMSAAAIAASMLTMVSVSAADTETTIDSIAYNFTVKSGTGTVTWKNQNVGWAEHSGTVTVTGAEAYTATVSDMAAADGLTNLGFFENEGGDMAITLDSITVNGDIDFVMDTELNTNDNENGLGNIWNDQGKADVIATSTKGDYKIVGDGGTSIKLVAVESTDTPDTPAADPADAIYGGGGSSWQENSFDSLKDAALGRWDGVWFQIDYNKEGYTADVSDAKVVLKLETTEDLVFDASKDETSRAVFKFMNLSDSDENKYKLVTTEESPAGTVYTYEFAYSDLLNATWIDDEGYEQKLNAWDGGFGTNLQNGIAGKVTAYMTGVKYTENTDEPENPEEPAKKGFNAFLMFTDGNWGWGNWLPNGVEKEDGSDIGKGTDANITGNGTYTVSVSAEQVAKWYDAEGNEVEAGTDGATAAPAAGVNVFCVDMVGLADSLGANSSDLDKKATAADKMKLVTDKGVSIKDVAVTVDGAEFYAPADADLLYGDIEGNGNLRLEIYNQYGETANNADLKTKMGTLAANDKIEVTFTIAGLPEDITPVDPEDPDDNKPGKDDDNKGDDNKGDDNKADDNKKDDGKGDDGNKADGNKKDPSVTTSGDKKDDGNKNSGNDANPSTGAAALATVGVLLAGAAVVATKKK